MNKEFTATLVQSEAKGGWTYLVWPESVQFFGTRGRRRLAMAPGAVTAVSPGSSGRSNRSGRD